MIERYLSPNATIIFSDQNQVILWKQFSVDAMLKLIEDPVLADELSEWRNSAPPPTPESVKRLEVQTQHDVVAFLTLFEAEMPMKFRKYLHYGMTSSDLVENTLHYQLRLHAIQMNSKWAFLDRAVKRIAVAVAPARWRPGRTHGQLAEPTTLEGQLAAWSVGSSNIGHCFSLLTSRMNVTKTFGPTGDSLLRDDMFDNAVPSTQIINRDIILEWASVYLRAATQLESLAMLVRFGSRAEVGELVEGRSPTAVGSSAMPHKRNPIRCEQVCGLARLARGYFMAIAETAGALWEDRDISNSCVERVALVDLAHVVERMCDQMTGVISGLEVNADRMKVNAKNLECWSSVMQGLVQKVTGVGPIEAGGLIRDAIKHEHDFDIDVFNIIYQRLIRQFRPEVGNEWLREFAKVWDNVFGEEPFPPF